MKHGKPMTTAAGKPQRTAREGPSPVASGGGEARKEATEAG